MIMQLHLTTYGEINSWDVSQITDMSNLFDGKQGFNSDISNWDVSGVMNMSNMFRQCLFSDFQEIIFLECFKCCKHGSPF